MTYLDTHVTVRLYEGYRSSISVTAQSTVERDDDLRISPLVLLEMEYLYEIKRLKLPSARIFAALESEIGLRVCHAPFPLVIHQALEERWTHDPFDRIIVAQARVNDATLITLDRTILRHYPNALA